VTAAQSLQWMEPLAGTTEEEVGLDRLRDVAATITSPIPWWIVCQVWLGLN
jgi:hypothetical protein